MEEKIIMVYVPLNEYAKGQAAIARLDALKSFTIKSDYSISQEDIASILGFELPEKRVGRE